MLIFAYMVNCASFVLTQNLCFEDYTNFSIMFVLERPMGRCCRKRSRLRHAVQMGIMGNRYPIRMNWRQTRRTGLIWLWI